MRAPEAAPGALNRLRVTRSRQARGATPACKQRAIPSRRHVPLGPRVRGGDEPQMRAPGSCCHERDRLGNAQSLRCAWFPALRCLRFAACASLLPLRCLHLATCASLLALGCLHLAACTWLLALRRLRLVSLRLAPDSPLRRLLRARRPRAGGGPVGARLAHSIARTLTSGVHMQQIQTSLISVHRSRHCGFAPSISRSFQTRFHFLSCFSRAIADSIVECTSKKTS
jgi:hypothetical protein